MSCRSVQDKTILPTAETTVIEKLFPFAIVTFHQEYDFGKQINLVVSLHGQSTWDFLN